ncbi:MAG: hypothetical protein ACXQTY_02865 [Candidatus Methanogasteraceae archaeon]
MPRKKETSEDEISVFTPEMDEHIKKGGAAIAKILKGDVGRQYIQKLIEYHLEEIGEDTHDDLTMALALAFGEDIGRTITFPLFTNDPLVLAEYSRLKIPDPVITYLRYIVALYGAKAEHAAICLKNPDGLEQTRFDLNYRSDGRARSITMKLTRADSNSLTITDEPESYFFLAYQILEQLSAIQDTDSEMREIFEKIKAMVESKIRDDVRDYIDA